ncbi:MAG: hydantoinase B/oxoprolinase family protein [Candidatus Binataceae bacterium]|nr:hydantoinase B/oxoprolinase family protein [Candidatus Binataceae bacterium]
MGKLFDSRAIQFEGFIYDRDVYPRGPGYDPAIIAEGLAPITEIEQRGMDQLSDVDLEILSHKLTCVVEEAHDVYQELSISEAILTGDMNTGILTASGDPAVVATGIYFHSMLNCAQAKYILRYYKDDPTLGLKDGDIYFFNDDFAGVTHVYDMFTTMPIFYRGELVAWATCGGHQGDTGGMAPGGHAALATSRFEEGLRVPQLRIGENFQIRTDILDYLCQAVRNPLVFASDLKARVATCLRIRDRLVAEMDRRGPEPVVGGMRKLLSRAGRLARERLAELPDGIFRAIIFTDNLGRELGLSRIPTTVFKEGDELTVLVNGVSPEASCGAMNATWHLVRAALGVYLFSYFFRGLPPNAGLLEPVRVLVEGPSILNATGEVARGFGTQTAACVVQNLHIIGSKIAYAGGYEESVTTPFSRNPQLYLYAGENRRGYQQANISTLGNAAGQGAQFDRDGESAFGFYWGACVDSGETEALDSRYTNFRLARRVECNAHGFGKYRGGAPLAEVSMTYGPKGCLMTGAGACDKVSQNPGLFGGYAGPTNPQVVIRNTNVRELMARSDPRLDFDTAHDLLVNRPIDGDYQFRSSSTATEKFNDGDLFVENVSGAGGYGDVLEREPQAVLEDVRSRLITREVAEKVYGVFITADGHTIDVGATAEKRRAIRAERLALGKPFAEFIKEWSRKKPPQAILKYYGQWPDPRVESYDQPFWGIYPKA